MINTIAELLLNLKDKEQTLLKQYDIVKHPGIIGDMYEGLTKDILEKSVFKGLNLNVKSGKIRNKEGDFSGEIDCMIVIGDGEQIPYTDKHIYDSVNVVAVIQVKKNLFTKGIKESFENLRTVVDITELRDGLPHHMILLRDTWRSLFKEELPARENLKDISIEKQMIYHILSLEILYPARIVWGYNGFKSEFNLRESLVKYLMENTSSDEEDFKKGFGPLNFPSLIMCDKYSLIKNNGIPFAYPVYDEHWWPFYTSSHDNPVYFLLEIIWTRLSYMYSISSDIFGEDLTIDTVHSFLDCKYQEKDNLKGWEYKYIPLDKEFLEAPLEKTDWEPTFLDHTQFLVLNELCERGSVNFNNNSEFIKLIEESEEYTIASFIGRLRETGLISVENLTISLITVECVVGVTKHGEYFAGDNKSGRVTRWSIKQNEK